MKKTLNSIFALCMGVMVFTACDDAKNDVVDNRVYISEAVESTSKNINVGDPGEVVETSVTVRLGHSVDQDVNLTLALNQSHVDNYNKRNETEYQLVPAQYVSFPAQVTIPAGKTSVNVPIEVTAFEGEPGVEYVVSLGITGATGMEVASGNNAFMITMSSPLKQFVPAYTYNENSQVYPYEDWGVELSSFTLEWWARVTANSSNQMDPTRGYTINNQAIFTFGGNRELYIRFGDAIYGNKYNFLQIKYNGSQFDTGDPRSTNPLSPGVWYHFAMVYDGPEGLSTLYLNGNPVSTLNTNKGDVMAINGLTLFGAGSTYHRDFIELCQVRLWNVARTSAQIQKNMYKNVKYSDPSLVMYLPMNEGTGKDLLDVTGNGHNVEIGATSSRTGHDPKFWTEYTFSK